MSKYIPPNNRKVPVSEDDTYNNQVVLSGVDESYLVPNGTFFLEYLDSAAGVTIKDGNGTTIATGVTTFEMDHAPLRCDYGIQLTGTVKIVKGFVLRGIFQE